MTQINETRRVGRRASDGMQSLGRDCFSDNAPTLSNQSNWLADRYFVSPAIARVMAEHVFGSTHGRATR